MKKIIVCNPGNTKTSPSSARVSAYGKYFEKKGFYVDATVRASGHLILNVIWRLFSKGGDYILISMPPFRGWLVCFLPFSRVILDVRDGWSIAIASGYGGIAPKKPLKARAASWIERLAIRRSFATITCTNGLQEHLQNISGHPVLLIPNGVLDDDLQLIEKIRAKNLTKKDECKLIFSCAGQFSEYGLDKARKLLGTIAKRYASEKSLVVRLIGSDPSINDWADSHFQELTANKGRVEILPRMDKEQLFATMMAGDFGLVIIRDPDYDFGTKVFDYIALGLPVVNYFDEPNRFTDYFDACLDRPFGTGLDRPEIRRSTLIEKVLDKVNW